MKCPFCGSDELKVIDKRESDNDSNRRRRECQKCEKRFTTYERVELDMKVIKKDGRREPYNRDKIIKGLTKACEKRPVSSEQINKVADEIESELLRMDGNDISSKDVGDILMKHLKKLDQVAYIRFASVYREFQDVHEFEKELKKLK